MTIIHLLWILFLQNCMAIYPIRHNLLQFLVPTLSLHSNGFPPVSSNSWAQLPYTPGFPQWAPDAASPLVLTSASALSALVGSAGDKNPDSTQSEVAEIASGRQSQVQVQGASDSNTASVEPVPVLSGGSVFLGIIIQMICSTVWNLSGCRGSKVVIKSCQNCIIMTISFHWSEWRKEDTREAWCSFTRWRVE